MSSTLERIKALVAERAVKISDHGYDELIADNLWVGDIVEGVADAELIEDYPNFPKGPCILVLERDRDGKPVHAVWGIPKGESSPAVLVTAYRPDAKRWMDDFRRRKI